MHIYIYLILLVFLVLFDYSQKEYQSMHVQFLSLFKNEVTVKSERFN